MISSEVTIALIVCVSCFSFLCGVIYGRADKLGRYLDKRLRDIEQNIK